MFKKTNYVAIDGTEFDYIDECEEYERGFFLSSVVPELVIECDRNPIEFDDKYTLYTNNGSMYLDLKMHFQTEYLRVQSKKDMNKIKSALPKIKFPDNLLQQIIDVENLEHFQYPDVLMFIISYYKDNNGNAIVERSVKSYEDYKDDYLSFFDKLNRNIRKYDKIIENKKKSTDKKNDVDIYENGYVDL